MGVITKRKPVVLSKDWINRRDKCNGDSSREKTSVAERWDRRSRRGSPFDGGKRGSGFTVIKRPEKGWDQKEVQSFMGGETGFSSPLFRPHTLIVSSSGLSITNWLWIGRNGGEAVSSWDVWGKVSVIDVWYVILVLKDNTSLGSCFGVGFMNDSRHRCLQLYSNL